VVVPSTLRQRPIAQIDEVASLAECLGDTHGCKRTQLAGTVAVAIDELRVPGAVGEAGRKIHTGRSRNDQVIAALNGLPAGYHRDLQRTKRPLLRGLAEARAAISIVQLAVERLGVHPERCLGAMSDGIYATDRAYDEVRKDVPFREAYRRAKDADTQPMEPQAALRNRAHLGAPGTDQAGALREALGGSKAERYATGPRATRSHR